MTDMQIAETIVQQLGGAGRLRVMVGAYNFVAIKNGLSFRIKNQKANFIKITLNGKDLYDLEIGRFRGLNYKVVYEGEDLYNDMLKPAIEKATGMYLSLFKKGGKMAEGGSVSSDNKAIFESLKKGDKVQITYNSSIASNQTKNLVVKNRTRVGVGKKWESDKITLVNVDNPNGVKFFFYKRTDSGYLGYAIGDLAISGVKLKVENTNAVKSGSDNSKPLAYDRDKYNKLLSDYDKVGAFLDDATTEQERVKLRKQLDEIETQIHRYERNYAKGGMTEHGLKINDTIKSGGHIGKTSIRVHNSNNGDFRVDLDKGKRTKLEFNKQTKKYEDKMANGGEVGDFFYDSRKDKSFQVIFEDGNKMGIQYLGADKKPIGKVETITKGDFEYKVEKGAWGKYKQSYAKGGKTKKEPMVVRGYFEDEAIDYAKGGNMDDVRLKYAKKDINLLIKSGGMSIYDTKYGLLNLSYENGKFIIKNNKYNQAKQDYETIFQGDKNGAIKFVANSYQIDEMAKGGKMAKSGGLMFKHESWYVIKNNNGSYSVYNSEIEKSDREYNMTFKTELDAKNYIKKRHPKSKMALGGNLSGFNYSIGGL